MSAASSSQPETAPPSPADPLRGEAGHIRALLARLHAESRAQEAGLTDSNTADFAAAMRDKFIALDQDKAGFVYQVCRATGARTVVEAGTSFGVSTIYLALAVAANLAVAGPVARGRVVATEHEPAKAARAAQYWRECGPAVESLIELRQGDLRETLQQDLEDVDLLLLDIWAPMALPTLKVVQTKLRHGAVVITDNTVKAARQYGELLAYLRHPDSGFVNSTLPFSGGLEMSLYLPRK